MSEKPIDQQPGATRQMSPGGNRNALNKPVDPQGEREWSYGIFDCFSECGTFCLSCWCPCFEYGKLKSRFKHLQTTGKPHPQGGKMLNMDCLTYDALHWVGCSCFVTRPTRREIRNRYNIQGANDSDFLLICCCDPCTLTQESREIALEEDSLRQKSSDV
ncbi:PLAC8 family-domain-containing protein [Cantharellus anzutake]|uniref:PLAC8 family-domain-containing protein n=1 Tax=Cantharellus anzutake TaxID=1750568 RepID=UPI0019036761|nr:PLAC8 family-domain-containing protein [Cantharellus anzutake]KAF8325761.1 PLAC8 family-domain-containing protein [Cantharellus anzutake]